MISEIDLCNICLIIISIWVAILSMLFLNILIVTNKRIDNILKRIENDNK